MTSNEIPVEDPKDKLTKVCPYLGLLEDSQTASSFPSAANLCYHARPLASPNLEYQRSVCLSARRHTLCPVFIRSDLEPLPPDISGSPASKLALRKPIEKRFLLLILLGVVVLLLAATGVWWFFNRYGGMNTILSEKPTSPILTSYGLPLATVTPAVTNIPITPNLDISTDTAVPTPTETETPQFSPTYTPVGLTPVYTQLTCGSPNTWVVYIVRPGDSLYRLSQAYGVTIAELQRANCLGASTTLHTGQLLYVPPTAPIVPSATLPIMVFPTLAPTDTQVMLLPSDTPVEIPTDTATEIPIATDVPTDTPASP